MQYAGSHRYLTYASWILSAGSALLALVPFWYLWKIIAEVIDVMPDFSKAEHLIQNGWLAVLFAVLSFVVYVCGLMCSHLSAFRVATNLRLQMCHSALHNNSEAANYEKPSTNPAEQRKPIWLTCCLIRQMQLQPQSV